MHARMERWVVAEAPNWGGANAWDKRRPPMMKGEDTKESWCGWSYQTERHRSSKHRKWDGRLGRVHRNSLFLCDGSDLSQVHIVNLRVTGDIPDEGGCDRFMTDGDTSGKKVCGPWKEPKYKLLHDDEWRHLRQKVYGPWNEPKYKLPHDDRRRHLGWKVWGPWYESKFRPSHDDRRRHLRRRCEDHDMSSSSDRLMTTGGHLGWKVWGPWYESKIRPSHDDRRRHFG